ncbi:tyrosine-type recombinase/integrase [Rhodoplanes roseus]|uniref:tyrosine-type recombinase/integrase n=1 Tax=Rhodoplanes roseus TaxID=29409 RepID=UPI00147334A0|nr:tyrosine-type recombinase/integrase [Rhodoplanes roseus]
MAGTVRWLIDQYRLTPSWTGLAPATRKQREAIFRQVIEAAGHEPLTRVTQRTIVHGRDRRASTPVQCRHYLDAMRGLFRWAVDERRVKLDPTEGVKAPTPKKSIGFPVWTADDVEKFEAKYPLGTRERVAFDVLRYTGFRRSDAVLFGRQHVRNGIIRLRTQKTGEPVTISMPPALAATIEAGPVGDLTFITNVNGSAFVVESFGNWFRDVCRAAKVEKSAHGLRKWYASRLAEEGATSKELQAACGWTSSRMAELYTRSADRERLGLSGSRRMTENVDGTSIPSPGGDGEGSSENNNEKSET